MGTHDTDLQADTKYRRLRGDADCLAETLTRDLLHGLVRWNLVGQDPEAFSFKHDLDKPDAKEMVDSAKTMFDMRIPVKVDEVRGFAGFSKPEPGDAVLEQPPEQPGAGGPGQPPPGGKPPLPGMNAPAQPQAAHEADSLPQHYAGRVEWVRAPKGGATSDVNGEHYIGGRFMPVHGLSDKSEKEEDKGGEGAKEPPKPNEDASGKPKREPRPPMTPEDIAAEKERRETQRKWDTINAGPLGRMKWFGDHPNSKALSDGRISLDPWKEYAEQAGEDKVKQLAQNLDKAVQEIIDEELAEDQRKGKPELPEDNINWYRNTAKRTAEEEANFLRGSKKHLKAVPSSYLARQLAQDYLGKAGLHGAYELNRMLAGDLSSEVAEPTPHARDFPSAYAFTEADHPRGQPGNAGQFGPGGGAATKEQPSEAPSVDIPVAGESEEEASFVREGVAAAWDKMPAPVRAAFGTAGKLLHAVDSKLMIGFHKAKELAAQVARKRGLGEEYVEKAAKILGTLDLVSAWTVNMPATLALTGNLAAAKVSSWVPIASLAFIGYSGIRNAPALWRAAKKVATGHAGPGTVAASYAREPERDQGAGQAIRRFGEAREQR